jgi:acetylornithine deacetylase/succinyl-diaminopimelate desuccinylase-like protein
VAVRIVCDEFVFGMTRGAAVVAALVLAVSAASAAPKPAFPLEPTAADIAEARALYARAVGFDTSVSGGQVPALIAHLHDLYRKAGFAEEDLEVVPFEKTASFLARYRGDGTGGKPILFLAHLDVVEARREEWKRDPFTLIEENGYFFGRGTSDNKSGAVTITATMLALKRAGFVPTRDLVVAFTGDEEVAQLTVQQLLRDHRDWLDAEFALNSDGGGGSLDEATGKPTIYGIQTAEKTYASFRLTVRNAGGHSSMPRKDNAIYDLAAALGRLQAAAFPVMWNDTTVAAFAAEGAARPAGDELGAAMRDFARKPGPGPQADRLVADPGYQGSLRTTCVPTLLAGGHAENALPQTAEATVNCRIFPGVPVEQVAARLREVVGAGVELTAIGTPSWSDASPLRADVLAAVGKAVSASTGVAGLPVTPYMESGASDGLFYRAAGIPTYGVGEGFYKGSEVFAHGLDERVPVRSFERGLVHWRVLIRELASPR